MNNCPVCQTQTTPIKIGTQNFCSICGTSLTPAPAVPGTGAPTAAPTTPAAPRRLSMDLAPRAAASTPAPAAPAPAATPAARPSTPAAALHGRVKPSQVLDLRQAPVAAITDHKPAVPPAPKAAAPAPADSPARVERHRTHLDTRLEKARQVERSAHIRKFNSTSAAAPTLVAEAAPAPAPTVAPTPAPAAMPAPAPAHPITPIPAATFAPAPAAPAAPIASELPPQAITQHEAMVKLAAAAPPAPPVAAPAPAPRQRPKMHFTPHHGRVAATMAAVALMGGYIWLSNYPKFALQSASNQAGLTATLPGYLPSSYTLQTTETRPGLVTLNFASPSATEKLSIAQHRTTWDSRSLLDNFVAKTADDYSTVQSQGLTIYLFNNNQAAWVNHGIFYSIEGASRLSREQILKIAYSL